MNITLTADQLNVVLAALQELPYKVAAPVMHDIMSQVQAQHSGAEIKEETVCSN